MYKAFRFNYDPIDTTLQLQPQPIGLPLPLYIRPLGSEYDTVKESLRSS